MIYVICFCSICCNFIFIAFWGYSEGNIDAIIHYLGINFPDALKGIREDFVVRLGHAPHYINSGKHNLYRGSKPDIDDEEGDEE